MIVPKIQLNNNFNSPIMSDPVSCNQHVTGEASDPCGFCRAAHPPASTYGRGESHFHEREPDARSPLLDPPSRFDASISPNPERIPTCQWLESNSN